MSTETPVASIPAAWLKPLPDGYTIPTWRWILLPATALMLKHYGGVWVSGDLRLQSTDVVFTQAKAIKLASASPEVWTIPLNGISDVEVTKGIASETIRIHHSGRTARLMTARSSEFVETLNQALSSL